MHFNVNEVHQSWRPFFQEHAILINDILAAVGNSEYTPERENIFRAFTTPKNELKVVIFGQDPYPGAGIADGLAFSSRATAPIPASLRNIFREYSDDLGFPAPTSPDLSQWARNGVLLLNRSLTTVTGERNSHIKSGWGTFTEAVARELAAQNIAAILWGNSAKELSQLFPLSVESVHPSPLSARRGFFGSRPFSRVNELLAQSGRETVNWKL